MNSMILDRKYLAVVFFLLPALVYGAIVVSQNWSPVTALNNHAVNVATGNGTRGGAWQNGKAYKVEFKDGTVAWFQFAFARSSRFVFIPGTVGLDNPDDVARKLNEWLQRQGSSGGGGGGGEGPNGGYAQNSVVGSGGYGTPVVTVGPDYQSTW